MLGPLLALWGLAYGLVWDFAGGGVIIHPVHTVGFLLCGVNALAAVMLLVRSARKDDRVRVVVCGWALLVNVVLFVLSV